MKDLLFELQVKNYEKVHKNLSELDSDAMTDELWFGRGVAALGLSAVDRDRTKEAKMCIGKIESEVNEELFVELDITINDFAKSIHNGSINAYNKDMMRDKPDNVNYGLQMISGNIAKTGFLLSLAEAYENICHIYKTRHPFVVENDAISKKYNTTINYLNQSGFNKTDIYKKVGKEIEEIYGTTTKKMHEEEYDYSEDEPSNLFIFIVSLLGVGFIFFVLFTQMLPELFQK